MTSEEWEKSGDPAAMLRYLTRRTEDLEEKTTIYPSDRKLRLFACACRRQTRLPWDGPSAGWTRMEDHPEEPIQGANAEYHAMLFVGEHRHPDVSLTVAADLLRAIVGNPWRPYTLAPAYRTPLVLSLAEAAYEERRADGTLDLQRLAILADALEDAGVPGEVEVERVCSECGGAGFVPYNDDWLEPCLRCGKGRLERPRRGTGKVKVRIPNPLLSRLRSGGPFYRGEASLDVILNKE